MQRKNVDGPVEIMEVPGKNVENLGKIVDVPGKKVKVPRKM